MSPGHASRQPIRLLLVDDHALVRDALRTLIEGEPDLAVCGTAGTAVECRDAIARLAPDLIILDLSLADCDGTRLIHEIAAGPRPVRILVLSSYEESTYAERCLHAGASGYVNKRAAADDIRRAIRAVAQGRVFLSDPFAARRATMSPARAREHDEDGPRRLSDRELELFQLLGHGLGPSEIANAMGLSVKTVEGYEARIQNKLDLESATALSRFAVDWYRGANR